MYDVCIVGAGPAGATLARLISEKHRVLLVDRRGLGASAEGSRCGTPISARAAKVCGGLLAPAAQKELARQGLGVPAEVMAGPQLFAVRTVDRVADIERLYQRFYLNVDREAFDRWLVSLVPDRVDTAFGWTAEALERTAEGAFVRFRTAQGGTAGVSARLVIGADGASSLVRRIGFPQLPALPRYVAVQALFESRDAEPFYGAVFDSRLTDYYGWTVPKAEGMLVGAAFPPGPGVPGRFARFVEVARQAGFAFGDELSRAACSVARPSNPWQLTSGSRGVGLLGEAAGLISPSSAEGISYALRSAAACAHALEPGIDGALERYRVAARPLAFEVTAKLLKSAAVHGPTVRRLVMRSGVGAIPRGGFEGVSGTLGELLTP